MAETSLKYFKQVVSVVSQFDISEEACLNVVGLTEFPSTRRVDADLIAEILNFAATHLKDPLIGIKCGLKYPILQYTRPSEFLKLCENIEHAAEVYHRYCPLFHTVGRSSGVISENGTDRMIWVPEFEPHQIENYRQHVEFIMINYVTSINWLAWKIPNAVERVHICHDPLTSIRQYEDTFGCHVEFGQIEYSVILRDGVKDAPFSTSDSLELMKVLGSLDMALNEYLKDESFVNRVELQIRQMVEYEVPKKAAVAEALGMSERSLGRLLMEKGTSFKDVKTSVLKGLATAKIFQGLPLAEIAQSLGYNDQSAFTRAYKKWFGHPPGEGRR